MGWQDKVEYLQKVVAKETDLAKLEELARIISDRQEELGVKQADAEALSASIASMGSDAHVLYKEQMPVHPEDDPDDHTGMWFSHTTAGAALRKQPSLPSNSIKAKGANLIGMPSQVRWEEEKGPQWVVAKQQAPGAGRKIDRRAIPVKDKNGELTWWVGGPVWMFSREKRKTDAKKWDPNPGEIGLTPGHQWFPMYEKMQKKVEASFKQWQETMAQNPDGHHDWDDVDADDPVLPTINKKLSGVLEAAPSNKDDRWQYEIDFLNMTQTNLKLGIVRKIRRFGMDYDGHETPYERFDPRHIGSTGQA